MKKRMCGAALQLVVAFVVAIAAQLLFRSPAIALEDQSEPQLPTYIDERIPDNAVLLSCDIAKLSDGSLVYVKDGSTVIDPELTGTDDCPPDPLTLSGGAKFSAMSVGEARSQMSEAGVSLLSTIGDNEYGAHWGTYNGEPAFFDRRGNMFVCQAQGVIDVSEHNGTIDWQAVKDSGVDAAIIRIGFRKTADRWRADYTAARNISECKRLGIPFGVYFFSYAEEPEDGTAEGNCIVGLLNELGVKPSDLSLPVFYDLEEWEWSGHTTPSDSATYTGIAQNCFAKVERAGFKNTAIYTNAYKLIDEMKSDYLREKAYWVAQVGGTMAFRDFRSNFRGWQYSFTGNVSGINTDVDLSAFGNAEWVNYEYDGVNLNALGSLVTDVQEGDYFIKSSVGDRYIDIWNGSTANCANAISWQPNNGKNQVFHIKPIGDGTYTIQSKLSGKYLDADNANYRNGTSIIQFDGTGGTNQRWQLYRKGDGTYLFASVMAGEHNKVIDIANGSTDNGVKLALWAANGGDGQSFRLQLAVDVAQGGCYCIDCESKPSTSIGFVKASLEQGDQPSLCTTSEDLEQVFEVESLGNGLLRFRSRYSGLLLDLSRGSSAPSTSVTQFSENGGANQAWYLKNTDSGMLIQNAQSNTALGSETQNGSIACYPESDFRVGAWNLRQVDSGYNVVRYDAQGGSDSFSKKVTTGAAAQEPADPTRQGYEFVGWFTESQGGSLWNFSSVVSSDMTLYAHWLPLTGWRIDQGGAETWYEDGVKSDKRDALVSDPLNGNQYWVGSEGHMTKDRVVYVKDLNAWCYFGKDGAMLHGEAYLSYDAEHTGWYYFDEETGAMVHGVKWLASSGGKWVYYDIHTGIMKHGEAYLSYDEDHTGWYYFDEVTGAMAHGDVYLSVGSKWVRYDKATGQMVHGLQYQDGAWYYFDQATGAMAHGWTWVPEWGARHYFDANTGRG